MSDADVEQELARLRQDPRYNMREYMDKARYLTSPGFVNSLGVVGKYVYVCVVITCIAVLVATLYVARYATKEVWVRVTAGLAVILVVYVATRVIT